jgi:hypothetical protein
MKKKHGGKRKGAGKKLLYGEKLVMVPVRVPASKLPEVVRWIEGKKKEWRKDKTCERDAAMQGGDFNHKY